MVVKIFYSPKVIRFDINPIISTLSSDDTNQESELSALIGGSSSESNIIVMSYRLHITKKSDNTEVIGYRLEQGFAYTIETKEKDKESIKELFNAFYKSLKKHIEENADITLIEDNDYSVIADKVISSLEVRGFYL